MCCLDTRAIKRMRESSFLSHFNAEWYHLLAEREREVLCHFLSFPVLVARFLSVSLVRMMGACLHSRKEQHFSLDELDGLEKFFSLMSKRKGEIVRWILASQGPWTNVDVSLDTAHEPERISNAEEVRRQASDVWWLWTQRDAMRCVRHLVTSLHRRDIDACVSWLTLLFFFSASVCAFLFFHFVYSLLYSRWKRVSLNSIHISPTKHLCHRNGIPKRKLRL